MNKPLSLALFCLLLPSFAHADDTDDERRRLLDEGSRQTRQYRESSWLGGQDAAAVEDDSGYINIGGQVYSVGDTAEELESAIYHAINARQWHKAEQFAARYATLPQHKPSLLDLAAGLQARARGDYRLAAARFKRAAAAEPGNARISLELARVYTEDNQNREAAAEFRRAVDIGLPEETRALVGQYQNELGRRRSWHGQLSLGYGYNSNINQGNGSRLCVWQIAGICLMERVLPQPIASGLWQYSATALRTLPLSGHHGIHLRGLAYGTHYHRDDRQQTLMPDYGYDTTSLYAGYNYADARNHFSMLPYFEYDHRNHHTHYRAWGTDAEWTRTLSPRWQISARGGAKRHHYSGKNRRYFADYSQYEAGIGAEWAAGSSWGLSVNLDAVRKAYAEDAASSREYALRFGFYKMFGQTAYANLLLMHRPSRYDAAGFISNGERREDKQYTAVAALGFLRWQRYSIYPELRFKHTVNRSNADYYRYRQNEVLLNLRYRF